MCAKNYYFVGSAYTSLDNTKRQYICVVDTSTYGSAIWEVVLNDTTIPLTTDAMESIDCEYANPCTNVTCGPGTCFVNGTGDAECNCTETGAKVQLCALVSTFFTGFEGSNCETMIDYCVVNNQPCVNGNCTPIVGNYTCTCVRGWLDRNCDREVDCGPLPPSENYNATAMNSAESNVTGVTTGNLGTSHQHTCAKNNFFK